MEQLQRSSVKQLKQIAKELGFKRYSQMIKAELIEAIKQAQSPSINIIEKSSSKKLKQQINPVFEKLNVEHMRAVAKEHGIKKYYFMTRNELIEELGDMDIDLNKLSNIVYKIITASKKYECIHGSFKYQCKECHGSQICIHNKRKTRCKECGGGGICKHKRERYICKECRITKELQQKH